MESWFCCCFAEHTIFCSVLKGAVTSTLNGKRYQRGLKSNPQIYSNKVFHLYPQMSPTVFSCVDRKHICLMQISLKTPGLVCSLNVASEL